MANYKNIVLCRWNFRECKYYNLARMHKFMFWGGVEKNNNNKINNLNKKCSGIRENLFLLLCPFILVEKTCVSEKFEDLKLFPSNETKFWDTIFNLLMRRNSVWLFNLERSKTIVTLGNFIFSFSSFCDKGEGSSSVSLSVLL